MRAFEVLRESKMMASTSFAGSRVAVARPTPRVAAARRSVTCMAKKGKQVRVNITIECTEQKASGVPGMSRYHTQKVRAMRERARERANGAARAWIRRLTPGPLQNRRNNPDRIELMKYNKYLRKMTLHRELKK